MCFDFIFFIIGDLIDGLVEGLEIIGSKEEYSKLEICQLYEMINETEVYAILNIEDKDVADMLRPFSVVMHGNKTVISDIVWNDYIKKQDKGVKLSLTEVATSVWAPCLVEIQLVVEKFHDRSITLKQIDYYLKDIPPQNLEKEVITLVEGCNKCLNLTMPSTWAKEFVLAVNRYRDACQAQNVAGIVLKAKEALMLTGSFKKLEKFREKV